MFERIDFYQRRCVRTVIDVVEQVTGRWMARGPMPLDESSVSLLLLWSWLRFESDFLTRCLEDLGVDLGALVLQVDLMLKERTIPKGNQLAAQWAPGNAFASQALRELTTSWLNRAADEAHWLHQGYVGMEHLLLAFLRDKGSPAAWLFSQSGIDHQRLSSAVVEAIARRKSNTDESADVIILDEPSPSNQRPIGLAAVISNLFSDTPSWTWTKGYLGTPAAGMPKRFSMAILMSWVTLFAVVFSLLKWLDTPPVYFGILTVLMFCVGIGQMWLFGGKNPRAASIFTGAVALSVEVFILNVATGFLCSPNTGLLERIIISVIFIILCIPLGAFFGYLAGGLTAGIVLGLDYLEKRKADKKIAEENEDGGEVKLAE
jgi:hypothetical protein